VVDAVDRDAVAHGQLLQQAGRLVVGLDDIAALARVRADSRVHVDRDEPRRRVLVEPTVQTLRAAVIEPRPFGLEVEAGGWVIPVQEQPQSALQPPCVVFKREVERLPLLDFDRAEGMSARGYGDAEREPEPRFAQLRSAAHERQPLGEKSSNRIPRLGEFGGEKVRGRPTRPMQIGRYTATPSGATATSCGGSSSPK
jgi:hypothetical protein